MRKLTLAPYFNIQLFGEGGDGGTGTGAAGAEPAGQIEAALAQPHKGVKDNPLAAVKYGLQEDDAPAAGEPEVAETDRNAKFEALIKGEYKDLYDARVRETIRSRLKGNEETVAKYNQLAPILDLLAGKYGVDASDMAALSKAIEDDESYYENEAVERGISVQQVKEMRRMQRENEALKAQMKETEAKQHADDLLAGWMQQGEGVKQIYPSFDLSTELQNEQFRALLRSNVPVQTAFEVVHKDEILPAAMQYTAQQVTQKVANSVRAGQKRPTEGAMRGQSPSTIKSDVSQLTKADRDEIDRRVARGEKIRF